MNETATFARDEFAIHLDEIMVGMYNGVTFTVATDVDALSSNGFNDSSISTVPREAINRIGSCSFSLPNSFLDDLRNAGRLETNQTLSRFGYTVFSNDAFFQPRESSESAVQFQGFEVGSVIVSATVAGIDRIENLTQPAKMYFQIKEVCVWQ